MSFLMWFGTGAVLLAVVAGAVLLAPRHNQWPLRCGWYGNAELRRETCAHCEGDGEQVLGRDGWGPPPERQLRAAYTTRHHSRRPPVRRIVQAHVYANTRDCPFCQGFGFTLEPADGTS